MQRLDRPAAVDEPPRQPVEQLRMGGSRAGSAEVARRVDETASEVPVPDPVGHDPRRQRVLGVGDPAGQLEPPAGIGGDRRRRHDGIGDPEEPSRLRAVGEVQMTAADVDGEIDDLAFLDRHGIGGLGWRGPLAFLDDGPQPVELGDRVGRVVCFLRLLVETEDAQPAIVDEPTQIFLFAGEPEVAGGELVRILKTQPLEVLVPGDLDHREQAGVAPGDLLEARGRRTPDQTPGQRRDQDLLGGDLRPQLVGHFPIAGRRRRRVGVPDLEDHARVGPVALDRGTLAIAEEGPDPALEHRRLEAVAAGDPGDLLGRPASARLVVAPGRVGFLRREEIAGQRLPPRAP